MGQQLEDQDGGLPQLLLLSEGEGGGDKLEQVELWGRMEEQGGVGIFGAFKLFIFKQTLVSRGMAGLP